MPLCRRAANSAAEETRWTAASIASQFPHHVAAEAVDGTFSRKRDELHVAGLAGLKADGGAGGNVQAHATSFLAVEFQGRVCFEEMVVRTDLDRAVASIGYRKRHGLAAD